MSEADDCLSETIFFPGRVRPFRPGPMVRSRRFGCILLTLRDLYPSDGLLR
jgi:hypothetical protein